MEGYFFTRGLRGEMLYLPMNVIVMRNLRGEFDVDCSPNNLRVFNEIWNKDRELIAGADSDSIFSVLDVPDELTGKFQDLCWRDDPLGIINRYIFATELFRDTEEAIRGYRSIRE